VDFLLKEKVMEQEKKGERVLISFDYAIKLLLRNKTNFDILEGFLSELLMRNVFVKSIGESESNKNDAKDKGLQPELWDTVTDEELQFIRHNLPLKIMCAVKNGISTLAK
jgi:hypothetical protein